MTMKITVDIDSKIAEAMEQKIQEELPGILNNILEQDLDEFFREIVIKQLRGCALIYLQSQEFRNKMLNKIKPTIDGLVGVEK